MDEELQKLRAKRLAEMQQQYGGEGGQKQNEEAERAAREAEMKNSILSQVLSQEARARLNTVALAKPEKAKMIENMLCNMARTGQIQGKLNEEQFKSLLEQVSQQTQKKTTVKFDRRRAHLDSDEDD